MPAGPAIQVESQFPQRAVQLPGVRLTQERALLGQQIDVERRRRELLSRQSFESDTDLWFQLHGTQSIAWMLYAIPALPILTRP